MFGSSKHAAQLTRMEAARRQTQHQLDLIDRQITRRMTALLPLLGRRQPGYRRGKAPAPGALLERYRANLAALTAELNGRDPTEGAEQLAERGAG